MRLSFSGNLRSSAQSADKVLDRYDLGLLKRVRYSSWRREDKKRRSGGIMSDPHPKRLFYPTVAVQAVSRSLMVTGG